MGKEVLGLTRGQLEQVQQDIATTRGLENPFIQAIRVPFQRERQRLAGEEAGITRNFGRRGVFGTLREQATAPVRLAREQLAEREAGAVTTGQLQVQELVDRQRNLARSLTSDISGQQQLQLQTALSALGLSNEAVLNIIRSQFPTGQAASESERFTGVIPAIGSLFS